MQYSNMYSISNDNLNNFLKTIQSEYNVYAPVKKNDKLFYKKYADNLNDLVLGEIRASDPLKAFYFKARETVVKDFNQSVPEKEDKPYCIIGAKACDLTGFNIQDYVFKTDDFEDPFYIRNREQNLIITADCTNAIETCFCVALGNKPYPDENFDINLSPLETSIIIETGSKKGEEVLEKCKDLLNEVSNELKSEQEVLRNKVTEQVKKNIEENNIPDKDKLKGAVEKSIDSEIWLDESKTCVECGACNSICPTCHCFLLYDQQDKDKMERLRVWDSCMVKDFAKVAGGANPREKLWMRLRNRFEKKFDFFPKVAGTFACTGCGRCISACPAKIDIRKVLKRLVEKC